MIHVFIVSDVRLYREGLQQVLERRGAIEIVGTAATGGEAVASIEDVKPDVVLIDLPLPAGAAAVRGLVRHAPGTKTVALAVPEIESEIVAWAEAGVSGYFSRDGSLDDLVSTIESVADGELPCSAKVAASLLRRVTTLAARTTSSTALVSLTFRQSEVLRLIEQGLSNKEIAGELSIALPTVKNHVHNIFEKLHVHRRADALARAGRPSWGDAAL